MDKQEPDPTTTPTVTGLEWLAADLVTLPAAEVDKLKRHAIAIVRLCDLAQSGRDDTTIPKRERR